MPESAKPLQGERMRPSPGKYALEKLTQQELLGLAAQKPAARFKGAAEGALPPPHVAERALAQLEAGMPAFWCVPFLIVERPGGAVLGGCTFKGMPVGGEVEIAYGVARQARGRGVATEAVAQLLQLAAQEESVQRGVAEILPSNIASSRLVSRLGFTKGPAFIDTDGETVVRWTYPCCLTQAK